MAAGTLVRRVKLEILGDDADAEAKIDNIRLKADELRDLHPELTPRINTAEVQAKMAVLRDELKAAGQENAGEVRIDTGEAQAKLAALRGEEKATAGESAGLGKAWDVAKYAILGVGAGLVYGVVKAAGFGQEITRLNTQAGVTKSQLAGLGSGVLALAGQVGQNPGSLAESLFHVESNFASLGITSPKALALVKTAAEGASVGGADMVDVTNALTAAVASGIPGVQNFQQAMGMLNATIGSGDMKMQDLADAFGSGMVAVVKGYGLSLTDVGAALATFGDNNIRGARAGTDLRMAVQALAVPLKTAPLAQFGLGVKTLAQDMQRGGLLKALDDLTARFRKAGVTGKTEGEYITAIFGKKAGAGVAVLLEQMDRLHSKYPAITKAAKDFGAAWGTQQETPQQQMKDLEAGSQALAISLGTRLLPEAMDVMRWLTSFVNGLERGNGGALAVAGTVGTVLGLIALKKLQDGLKGAVEGVEGLWKGGTKLAGWAGQLAGKLGILRTAQAEATVATEAETVATEESSAAFLANPIVLIIAALAALGVGIYELTTHCKTFRDFWKDTWRDIKIAFDDVFGFIKGHWPLIPGILLGPIAAAAALIYMHWRGIVTGAKWMFHEVAGLFESLPHRITSALGDLGSLLFGAGKAIVQGLINGVESLAGSAMSAVGNIASSMYHSALSFLGIGSPSKLFAWIGAQITAGLAHGVNATAQQAVDASRRLSREVAAAYDQGQITASQENSLQARITTALGSAERAIASRHAALVKTMTRLGLDMQAGMVASLEDASSASAAKSAAGKLISYVMTAWSAGDVSTGKASGMLTWLEADNGKLQGLAAQRQKLAATIKTADAYAASTTTATESAFSLTSAAGSVTPALGVGGIISQLLGDVSQIRAFKANIAKLRKMGLNPAYLNQLIQAGPVSGGPIAAELAAGSEGEIRQLNSAESAVAAASTSLGQAAANAIYDTGKYAGRGFLSGLQEQQAAITKLMQQIAREMVKTLRKELGIHSPSEVMRQHGLMIGEGLARGLEDSVTRVRAGATRMAAAAVPAGYGSAAGGGTRGGYLQIEWVGGGGADQEFFTFLKKHIRIRGGDPSVVGA